MAGSMGVLGSSAGYALLKIRGKASWTAHTSRGHPDPSLSARLMAITIPPKICEGFGGSLLCLPFVAVAKRSTRSGQRVIERLGVIPNKSGKRVANHHSANCFSRRRPRSQGILDMKKRISQDQNDQKLKISMAKMSVRYSHSRSSKYRSTTLPSALLSISLSVLGFIPSLADNSSLLIFRGNS